MMLEHAYQLGVELAISSIGSEGDRQLTKEANALASGLRSALSGLKNLGRGAKEGWSSWTTNTNLGRGVRRASWLMGMGAKEGSRWSRFHTNWIGMPTGAGLANMWISPEEEHKGKAFLKGFAGGLAFNAAMPVGSALGRGALSSLKRGGLAKHFSKEPGTGVLGLGNRYSTDFSDLPLSGKAARGAVGLGGMAGGLALGTGATLAVERALDRELSGPMGMSNRVDMSNPFNPVMR